MSRLKPGTVPARILAALHEYRPLPLDADDLAILANTTRANVQTTMTTLVRSGRVQRGHLNGTAQYFLGEPRET